MVTSYQEAVEKTIIASEQLNQIVNGTATAEVVVEDGSKIPSVRKALVDNFYFKDPLPWQQGQSETVFNQLRKFTDGTLWYAPTSTMSNVVTMGVSPVGDPLWISYSLDAIPKLTPQIREALRRSYTDAGYVLVAGSFEEGGTIVNPNDVLLQSTTGKAFSGPAGKVPAGTTPTPNIFKDVSFASRYGLSLKSAGVSKDNPASKNTAIIQDLINKAAGKQSYPTKIADLRSAQFLGPILWDVSGFSFNPLRVYANTCFQGMGTSFWGNEEDPCIVSPTFSENRAAFIFEPRDMTDWVGAPSGNGPYATGGYFKDMFVRCEGGRIFAAKHYALHYNHLTEGCIFTGEFDFFSKHDDGWAHWFRDCVSNTCCGAFWAFRTTLDYAQNCYCNRGGTTTGALFDFVISSYVESLNSNFSGHSSQRNTRALHLLTSVMNTESCIFEHWDLGRVQYNGKPGIDTSYYENISKYIYSLVNLSGEGLAPTSLIHVGDLVDNMNVSGSGNDPIIDISKLSPTWDSVAGVGRNWYSAKGAIIKAAPTQFLRMGFTKQFTDMYSNPVRIHTSEVKIYVSASGSNSNSGLSQDKPVNDLYTAVSVAASFDINPDCDVTIVLLSNCVFSVSGKTSVNARCEKLTISSGNAGTRVTLDMSGTSAYTCLLMINNIAIIDVDIRASGGSARNIIFDPNTPSRGVVSVSIKNSNLALGYAALFGDRSTTSWELRLNLENVVSDAQSLIFRQTGSPSCKIVTTYIKKGCTILGNEGGNIPVFLANVSS